MQAKPTNSRYQMLNTVHAPPRKQIHLSLHEFFNSEYLASLEAGPFALDFEANTNIPQSEDLYIRTVAVANDTCVVGVDMLDCSSADWEKLLDWVNKQKIVVFNALYDSALLYSKSGKLVLPYVDLYIVFKMLGGKKKSTDPTANHSLKAAQVNLLGWEDKGSDEIKNYMKSNDLTWKDIKKFDKTILLKYNCLDADSTWALYKLFRGLVTENIDTWGQYFAEWHREDTLTAAGLWIEALQDGLSVDEKQLATHQEDCTQLRDLQLNKFMTHPKLSGGIKSFNAGVLDEIVKSEPPKFKKDDTIAVRWLNWEQKLEKAKNTNHFNLNSPKQLQWLFYEYAKIPPPKENLSTDAESLNAIGEVGQILLSYRKMITELKFVNQLTENNINGKLYPKVVYPGTDTGRVTSREEIK